MFAEHVVLVESMDSTFTEQAVLYVCCMFALIALPLV